MTLIVARPWLWNNGVITCKKLNKLLPIFYVQASMGNCEWPLTTYCDEYVITIYFALQRSRTFIRCSTQIIKTTTLFRPWFLQRLAYTMDKTRTKTTTYLVLLSTVLGVHGRRGHLVIAVPVVACTRRRSLLKKTHFRFNCLHFHSGVFRLL